MNSNKIETEINMSLVFNQNVLLKNIPFTFKGDDEPSKKNRISRVGMLMNVALRMNFTLIPFWMLGICAPNKISLTSAHAAMAMDKKRTI